MFKSDTIFIIKDIINIKNSKEKIKFDFFG